MSNKGNQLVGNSDRFKSGGTHGIQPTTAGTAEK